MASGLPHATHTPCSGSLSLRLRVFQRLASPHTATRRLILQKARRHPSGPRHLAGPWFQVLFHSPRRGSFRLSLTVLLRYRWPQSIQPWIVVDPDSGRVPRAPPYSGTAPGSPPHSAYAAITLSGRASQRARLCGGFLKTSRVIPARPCNPARGGLGSSPFARRYLGNLC